MFRLKDDPRDTAVRNPLEFSIHGHVCDNCPEECVDGVWICLNTGLVKESYIDSGWVARSAELHESSGDSDLVNSPEILKKREEISLILERLTMNGDYRSLFNGNQRIRRSEVFKQQSKTEDNLSLPSLIAIREYAWNMYPSLALPEKHQVSNLFQILFDAVECIMHITYKMKSYSGNIDLPQTTSTLKHLTIGAFYELLAELNGKRSQACSVKQMLEKYVTYGHRVELICQFVQAWLLKETDVSFLDRKANKVCCVSLVKGRSFVHLDNANTSTYRLIEKSKRDFEMYVAAIGMNKILQII